MSEIYAGIDLGGTTIKAAVADRQGNVVGHKAIATESDAGPDHVIDRIASLIQELASDHGRSVASVGMGVPGLVDVASGVTQFLPNLPTQWREVSVGQRLSKAIGCPVQLLNDVRTATLAELKFGHGRDHPRLTLAFFSLGTGIGGGVAIDGQLRLGSLGAAGELGHQTIITDGPRCGCGNRGCLETLASGPAIAAAGIRLMKMGLAPTLHEIVQGDTDRVTVREMVQAAPSDELIREAIVTAGTYVGIAAANVVVTLHPDMIVLGGGVAEIGDLLTTTVKQVITERVGMFPTDSIRVNQSRLRDRAGVLGAIALALNHRDSLA